jgi:hypothetical protein
MYHHRRRPLVRPANTRQYPTTRTSVKCRDRRLIAFLLVLNLLNMGKKQKLRAKKGFNPGKRPKESKGLPEEFEDEVDAFHKARDKVFFEDSDSGHELDDLEDEAVYNLSDDEDSGGDSEDEEETIRRRTVSLGFSWGLKLLARLSYEAEGPKRSYAPECILFATMYLHLAALITFVGCVLSVEAEEFLFMESKATPLQQGSHSAFMWLVRGNGSVTCCTKTSSSQKLMLSLSSSCFGAH